MPADPTAIGDIGPVPFASVGLQSVERRLERTVDGVFSRAFRSRLKPIELGKRLVREIDAHRSVDVKGRTVVPNAFVITLSADDHAEFAEIEDALVRELADAAREHALEEGYAFLGPVAVTLDVDPDLRPGRFEVAGRMEQRPAGKVGACLVLPDGSRIPVAARPVVIGRLAECDLALTEPNVSRRHAEIRPEGDGWVISDLGSTNGTRVNGFVVTTEALHHGDVITVGDTHLRFEAP